MTQVTWGNPKWNTTQITWDEGSRAVVTSNLTDQNRIEYDLLPNRESGCAFLHDLCCICRLVINTHSMYLHN